MDKIGTNITNGTKPLADTLNKPVNYFKGQANGALKAGLQKLGLANTSGRELIPNNYLEIKSLGIDTDLYIVKNEETK